MEKKKPAAERLLPVFVCNTDKGVKYIVPVYGAGLWGPIWGYIAMDSNGAPIYGPSLEPYTAFFKSLASAKQ